MLWKLNKRRKNELFRGLNGMGEVMETEVLGKVEVLKSRSILKSRQ